MTKTIEVLRILLPVALTLGLGALCREKKLLDRRGVEALKTVAVQIGLPAVLLHTFATADYSLSTPVTLCGFIVPAKLAARKRWDAVLFLVASAAFTATNAGFLLLF